MATSSTSCTPCSHQVSVTGSLQPSDQPLGLEDGDLMDHGNTWVEDTHGAWLTSASSSANWRGSFPTFNCCQTSFSPQMLLWLEPSCSIRSNISSEGDGEPITPREHWWRSTRWVFTLEVLILPLEGLQVLQGLLVGIPQLEELHTEGLGLLLWGLQLSLCLLHFLLPLSQHLRGTTRA